jgi:hypothetical protein
MVWPGATEGQLSSKCSPGNTSAFCTNVPRGTFCGYRIVRTKGKNSNRLLEFTETPVLGIRRLSLEKPKGWEAGNTLSGQREDSATLFDPAFGGMWLYEPKSIAESIS